MSRVCIVGIGIHRFGRTDALSGLQQGEFAARRALDDAGIDWKDVQFAYGGSAAAGNADTPRMNRAAPEAVAFSTQRQPSTLTGDGVDLDQRSGPHFRRQTSFSACRKRAFDQSPIDCQGALRTE